MVVRRGSPAKINISMQTRTLVTFRSGRFNTTETRPHDINPGCFGDDVAEWILQRVKERGVSVDEKVGQEDFGWYLGFRIGPHEYHFVLGYNADGYWIGWLERARSLIGNLVGLHKKGIEPEAASLIYTILSSSADISDVRWHFQKDFDALREDLGVPSPLGNS